MTDDEVLKLARDCGIHIPTVNHSCISNKEELIAFAAAVERATIERAAQVCDELAKEGRYCDGPGPKACARTIRALAAPDKES